VITLSISTLSVDIINLTSPTLPRIRGQVGNVTYTATGSNIGRGTVYEPFHIWDINAVVYEAEMQKLKAIYAIHDKNRRDLENADVTIDDKFQLYEEEYPRTRHKLSGTDEVLLPNATTPVAVCYYARFKGWFSQEPRFTYAGFPTVFYVSMQLMETTKVPST